MIVICRVLLLFHTVSLLIYAIPPLFHTVSLSLSPGIMGLSCYLPLNTEFPDSATPQNASTPIIMCHGNADVVVDFRLELFVTIATVCVTMVTLYVFMVTVYVAMVTEYVVMVTVYVVMVTVYVVMVTVHVVMVTVHVVMVTVWLSW